MRFVTGLLAACLLSACSAANGENEAATQADETEAQAIEAIVHRYIVENPEVIEEALVELQRRAREREQAQLLLNVEQNRTALFEDSADPVFGPADAELTIVEFFDYRCPYCRQANDWLDGVLEQHAGRVRIIYKELPLLGEASEEAARAALAVWTLAPESYPDFHDALMQAGNPMTAERINEIAARHGVETPALREAMAAPEIEAHLGRVYELARAVGVSGTPFFVVGNEIIPGADIGRLNRIIDARLAD
ncbi:MAG: DsbA family protein [Caulobacterales bacterium]|uniref:DsbA family protein n=1 Tax=Glycocaulis sp. TaxID=1969725 RepID=UPI003F9FEF23